MATEPAVIDEEDANVEHASPPRSHGNPIDSVAPTCMFWAMVAGLSIMLGIMLIWGISNLDSIAR